MKRFEEAYNYLEAGIPTLADILADCQDIAADPELKSSMIEQAGSVEEYAAEIFAAVEEIQEKRAAESEEV